MIYTARTKKALRLCCEAHKDQVDKSGICSILLCVVEKLYCINGLDLLYHCSIFQTI